MSEASLWDRTRDELSPFGKLLRVENGIAKGTPDVAYLIRRYPKVAPVMGWLELKYLARWPVTDKRPLVVPKLKREQVEFAEGWAAAGGRSFFLLQIGRDYVLLDPATGRDVFERRLPRPLVMERAVVSRSGGGFPRAAIIKGLTDD